MPIYQVFNGPMPTTASFAAVTTGTAIKTMLQLKPFNVGRIIEWGISFDGSAAATPIEVELLHTSTVNATVTASVDADVFKFDGAEGAVASVVGLTLGTAATGYTSTDEDGAGSITTTVIFDTQFIAPTNQYVKQFPLGREPKMVIGNFYRIRVKAGTAVNAICYMTVEF